MNKKMAINTYLSTTESKKKTKQMHKQNRNRLIDTENILTVARWRAVRRTGEMGEGSKKYKLAVAEQSWYIM